MTVDFSVAGWICLVILIDRVSVIGALGAGPLGRITVSELSILGIAAAMIKLGASEVRMKNWENCMIKNRRNSTGTSPENENIKKY